MDELISTAREAIGEGEPESDWKIVPTDHANSQPAQASPLADVLRSSGPMGLAKIYVEDDRRAVEARDEFKGTIAKANWAVFFTASLAALLLIAGSLHDQLGEPARWLIGAIGCLGVVTGFLAMMWISEAKQGGFSDRWSKARASAEAKRLTYFKSVMEEASDEPLDQLLAFEYTRRYLLQNQIDYFRDRGREHEKGARAALKISTRAVFLSSTLTTIAGLMAMWEPNLTVIAGIGVIATAYSALAVSRSTLSQDQRNADRYRLGKEQLEAQALDIDRYRKKVVEEGADAVKEFYRPIFVTLASDHKRFLNDAEKRSVEIGAIQDRLRSAQDAGTEKPAPSDSAA
jgi:hypothetical protein